MLATFVLLSLIARGSLLTSEFRLPPYEFINSGKRTQKHGPWFDGVLHRSGNVVVDESSHFVVTREQFGVIPGTPGWAQWRKQLNAIAGMVTRTCRDPETVEYCRQRRAFGSADSSPVTGHSVTFLFQAMAEQRDGLLSALYHLMRGGEDVGKLEVSSRLPGKLSVRVVESLTYYGDDAWRSEGAAPGSLGWHQDDGAFVSMVVMLSEPEEYEGGAFQLQDLEGHIHTVQGLHKGEAIVWRSWRRHRVTPVLKGKRHVLVMEFWDEDERIAKSTAQVVKELSDSEHPNMLRYCARLKVLL